MWQGTPRSPSCSSLLIHPTCLERKRQQAVDSLEPPVTQLVVCRGSFRKYGATQIINQLNEEQSRFFNGIGGAGLNSKFGNVKYLTLVLLKFCIYEVEERNNYSWFITRGNKPLIRGHQILNSVYDGLNHDNIYLSNVQHNCVYISHFLLNRPFLVGWRPLVKAIHTMKVIVWYWNKCVTILPPSDYVLQVEVYRRWR